MTIVKQESPNISVSVFLKHRLSSKDIAAFKNISSNADLTRILRLIFPNLPFTEITPLISQIRDLKL